MSEDVMSQQDPQGDPLGQKGPQGQNQQQGGGERKDTPRQQHTNSQGMRKSNPATIALPTKARSAKTTIRSESPIVQATPTYLRC